MKTHKLTPGILLSKWIMQHVQRNMRAHSLSIIYYPLFIFLSVGPLLAQNDVKEQLTVPLSDPGKPGMLHVGLVNGSINVTGYNGKEIVIDVTAAQRDRRDDNGERAPNGMKRIATNGGLDVSAKERNNRVDVDVNSVRQSVDLTIKVPQQCALKVSTVNHGQITIDNVSGEIEVSNVNGSIDLKNIAGSAVANTVNGGILATFKNVNTDAPMAFSTLNGNVDVTFPATSKMNVKLKSDRGDIYTDFDVDVDKSSSKVNRANQTGMYRVSIDDWVQGKINGGGREIMMKNMNGNIYIRKAK